MAAALTWTTSVRVGRDGFWYFRPKNHSARPGRWPCVIQAAEADTMDCAIGDSLPGAVSRDNPWTRRRPGVAW